MTPTSIFELMRNSSFVPISILNSRVISFSWVFTFHQFNHHDLIIYCSDSPSHTPSHSHSHSPQLFHSKVKTIQTLAIVYQTFRYLFCFGPLIQSISVIVNHNLVDCRKTNRSESEIECTFNIIN